MTTGYASPTETRTETPRAQTGPALTHRERYRTQLTVSKEACGKASSIIAWTQGNAVEKHRMWCHRWDEDHCGTRMGKAEVYRAMGQPVSAVLWRSGNEGEAATDLAWARVRQWLRRHRIESLTVRSNGDLWWFLKGDAGADRDLLNRGASRYGFIIMEVEPDEHTLRTYLTTAFAVEEEPLNGRRKFRASPGFYAWGGGGDDGGGGSPWEGDEEEGDEEREDRDSYPPPLQELEPSPDLRGDRIVLYVLDSIAEKWRQSKRGDRRYRFDELEGEDCWRAVWVGQGPRPPWGIIPGASVRGF